MSIAKKAARQGIWLGVLKALSQLFSWVITFQIARILVPEDYGLMELATLIIIYGEKFSELGLGAAIVQKKETTEKELSSIFWLSLGLSILFATACFPVAYITSFIFKEPRVIPITEFTSVIFIINGLGIVPSNLLQKTLSFKKIGISDLVSVTISSLAMYCFARLGYGVWTLVFGRVINGLIRMILVYILQGWKPSFYFCFKDARGFLAFGSKVAISRTVYYLYEKSDALFVGKFCGAVSLGLYTFAKDLSKIPTDRIGQLIRQISFPLLAALKEDHTQFKRNYLNIVRLIASLTFPLFVGGFLIGSDLVHFLLDEDWYPIIPLFRGFCLIEIITSLTAINNLVHIARGRPDLSLVFSITRAIVMVISFYVILQFGFNLVLVPWFTSYFVICVLWILFTLNKIEIPVWDYLRKLVGPSGATFAMGASVLIYMRIIKYHLLAPHFMGLSIIAVLTIGALSYGSCLWVIDRDLFSSIRSVFTKEGNKDGTEIAIV